MRVIRVLGGTILQASLASFQATVFKGNGRARADGVSFGFTTRADIRNCEYASSGRNHKGDFQVVVIDQVLHGKQGLGA